MAEIFVARQPIYVGGLEVFAYELSFGEEGATSREEYFTVGMFSLARFEDLRALASRRRRSISWVRRPVRPRTN